MLFGFASGACTTLESILTSIMAVLYQNTVPTGVQLSLIVPFVFLILFGKFLVAKLQVLVSQTLHVGDHHIFVYRPPSDFQDSSSFAIATRSSILKITRLCPHADTSGPMAKATLLNSWKVARIATYGAKNSAAYTESGLA
jgi:hypothetical protein